MTIRGIFHVALLGALLLLTSTLLLAACGGGDAGLTRAEVQEIARAEMAAAPLMSESSASAEGTVNNDTAAMPASDPGLSRSEVEGIVAAAVAAMPASAPGLSRSEVEGMVAATVAAMPEPRTGLTADEAERIARATVADIPPRSAPADYTRHFVESAIALYETRGLDATLAHYNREESVDGQWYVFIIDENDLVIAHPDPHRLSLDLKGWVGTDANGYNFGPDMLSATEEGKWVSYVYRNPESGGVGVGHSGALEYKHVWTVRHDGLLFASGWHVTADEYTRFVVDEAIARYHAEGLDAALEHYSNTDSVDGQWYVFIATPEGEILGHYNSEDFSAHLQEMLDDGSFRATAEGMWVNHEDVNPATGEVEDKHFWLVEHDGLVFGSGWHHDESGG